MKKTLFIIPFFLGWQLQSQSIDRQVIGSAGTLVNNETVRFSYTVGELAGKTITDGTTIVDQGFQQGKSTTPTIELSASSDGISVISTILYRPDATLGLDPGYDLGNFDGANFDIYTRLVDGSLTDNFTYQALPNSNFDTMEIPIGLKANAGKEVEFSINKTNLPTNLKVFIEDKELNNFILLDEVNTYTINLTTSENGVGRFYLHTKLEQFIWSGNTNSAWEEITNWNGNVIPTSTKEVVIPDVNITPDITGIVAAINTVRVNTSSSLQISEDGAAVIENKFINGGNVTISSTTNKSGSLIVKGSSNGQVTYERGGLKANVWSIVSAPVSGQSIKDFVENTSNDIRKNTSVTPNLYAVGYYDDSKAAGSKWVYYDVDYLAANPSVTFESGRSYAISRATDGVLSFTGTVATVDVPKAVTASEWNAVGNPYTAFMPINENSGTNFINTNAGNLDAAYVGVYVWDNTQNKYVAKSLVTAEASLAPGQGFFVKTGAGISTIDFNEAQRMVQPLSGGDFSRTTAQNSGIVLSAKTAKSTVTTTLKYLNTATEGLDPGYDLGNHGGASFDVYTRLVGSPEAGDFTIQSLPSLSEKVIIPVGLKAAKNSKITFTVSLDNLVDTTVFIEDKATGSFTKLKDSSYEFTTTEKISTAGRFYLHVQPKQEEIPTNLSAIKIYTATNHLIVSGIQKEVFTVRLFTIQGREVLSKTTQGTGVNEIALPSIPTGVYVVKLTSELGEKSSKVIIK